MSSISRMPRAIAPLETMISSSPATWRAAATSQSFASTSVRGSPSPSATTLEPSLITVRLMRGAYSGGDFSPHPLQVRTRVELEAHAPDLDLVAGLETLGDERLDHAYAPQPALEVRHRILVLDVEARQQPLDPRPVHRERALADALDAKARLRRRAEDHVLGEPLRAGVHHRRTRGEVRRTRGEVRRTRGEVRRTRGGLRRARGRPRRQLLDGRKQQLRERAHARAGGGRGRG